MANCFESRRTIYDLGKTIHLDYGCVRGGDFRTWAAGNYLYGSYYYLRGDVKAGLECGGDTICDTTVQANPQCLRPIAPGADVAHGTQVTILPNGNNCYWRHDK